MRYHGATTTAILAATFLGVAGVLAGDLAYEIARDFQMGILPRQVATNLQAFSGSLGGIEAPAISNSGQKDRQFEVDGETVTSFQDAVNKSCDKQKNKCADKANANNNNNNNNNDNNNNNNNDNNNNNGDGDGNGGDNGGGSGNNNGGSFKVGDCDKQNEQCKQAGQSATQTAFQELVTQFSNDQFDFICDL